jgi:hypothetical protein
MKGDQGAVSPSIPRASVVSSRFASPDSTVDKAASWGGGVGIGEVGGEGVGSSAPVVFSTLPVEIEDSDARSSLPSFFFWLCFARRTFSCNLLWRFLFRWVEQPTKEGVEVSMGTSWERVTAAVDGSDEPGAMALVSELTGVASASA